MCIGIPMKVIASDDGMADCEGQGRRERLNVMLIGDVAPGTWVLAYQGSAVRTLSDEEARQTTAALAALDAALAGDGTVDDCFADLVGREPSLPPHLRTRDS
jgi:hydrogenase expression/formation protein HypC